MSGTKIQGRNPHDGARRRLIALYDRLWSGAIERIRSGEVELDPVLQAGGPDKRRGLTVIAGPSLQVRRRVSAFLDELRPLEPEQHYYAASELHVTMLSLFTATSEFERFFVMRTEYISAVSEALKQAPALRIQFQGVTASPGTVMVQGFFEGDGLNELRESLRRQLRARGLETPERYRLQTAHMTVARFRQPLCQPERFAVVLEQARRRSFGSSTVMSLNLVEHDWYMSNQVSRVIKRYRLQRRPTGSL